MTPRAILTRLEIAAAAQQHWFPRQLDSDCWDTGSRSWGRVNDYDAHSGMIGDITVVVWQDHRETYLMLFGGDSQQRQWLREIFDKEVASEVRSTS